MSSKTTNIVIIGAGEIGNAFNFVLKRQHFQVEMWDREFSLVPQQKPLEETVPKAEVVFLCVPSQAVRPALTSILSFLPKKTIVVAISKGIEKKTNKLMSEVLQELLPLGAPIAFCGGPMLAEEIMKGQQGVAVLATKSPVVFACLEKMFAGSQIRLEWSKDVLGVAVAGVLKNVYAMALGMANGLGWSTNAQAWLLSGCLAEMEKIASCFGAKPETISSTAGLGDLVATGFSPFSKNREAGRTLAQTGSCCFTGEGAVSFSSVLKKIGPQIKKYPILRSLKKVIVQKQHAKKVFKNFITS
ncbi:MAG: Glycerol-3-phosphate dehydrogenase [NAD(P)+] [Candidatus Uhrbacteria bacterium GW2011_GWE2_45_35]|uniref:Glycerol-3-phosphate dehydrogenase [NAD(P)+] n=2 Tax=Candidatus Uhriibacteriota TaxID=1752732 RepID=A0A0G1JJ69_9BACT|nr:MAG: Glycerol-3-phosphate dehydrogenase [NAD(P)+] [Candidatus Uhrbacteria bacterium GW2011_GWF2_44_350]KKU07658.1 MAG: Glycerol-3-phosphate dehydrogenase [NAD(P)+] [Candidatus Uhrbacteria bacterium GW2011_GWE2_45_35]HBR80069.1 hypothetical protein [Candidatus Uhrbacteria bacterium]HCU31241.1 hypothetical protein [Candidatus Uhrbacteria bacterium]